MGVQVGKGVHAIYEEKFGKVTSTKFSNVNSSTTAGLGDY
jgi:hypothetical protein